MNYLYNKTETETFLQALYGEGFKNEQLCFQAYKKDGSPKILNGKYEEIESQILELERSGLNIAVTVNRTDGKGRKKENVKSITAFFCDLDGAPIQPILDFKNRPHIVVETSPGRYHAYWLVNNCPLDKFKDIQTGLIKIFNADPSVKDLCRVMRLPGFLNKKDPSNTTPCRIIKLNQHPSFNWTDFEEILPKVTEDKTTSLNSDVTAAELEEIISWIPADDYDVWFRVGAGIHYHFPNDIGARLFHNWSIKSSKYNATECTNQWNAFSVKSSSITIGTLKKIAKEHGYKAAKASNKRVQLTFSDYCKFIEGLKPVSDVKRDIIHGELMIKWEKEWRSAIEMIPAISSYAFDQPNMYVSRIKSHIARWYEEKKPELLIEIEKWDGIDRIKKIANIIRIKDFDSTQTFEILMHWGVNIFRRLENPDIQNRLLLLKGGQGCGKDTLVKALTGGFSGYAKELTINNETEAELHRALVFLITEFDKTSKTDVAQLKNLLTASQTNVRTKYDIAAKPRTIRASFISTVNVNDMFRDYTGNRRYIVLDCEYLGFPEIGEDPNSNRKIYSRIPEVYYPGLFTSSDYKSEQRQIVAQFKHYSELGEFRLSDDTETIIQSILNKLTPVDPLEEAVEEFKNEYINLIEKFEHVKKEYESNGFLSSKTLVIGDIFTKIKDRCDISVRKLKFALQRAGYSYRSSSKRGYKIALTKVQNDDSSIEDIWEN